MADLGTRLAYPGYRLAEWVACTLPGRLVPAAARVAGTVAWVVSRRRRRMVARHLRRVGARAPEGSASRLAVRATFQSYAEYWIDTFRLRVVDQADLERRFQARGLALIDDALAAGEGAILATPHLGSWDLAGAWLAGRGYPLVAVVERIEPPELLDWFVDIREQHGMQVIVRGPDVWDRLGEALGSNRLAVLVCDRDLSGRGVEVELFGERTTLPPGPAALSRRCGAPLIPVAVYGLGEGLHRGVVRPPVSVERGDDEEADVAAATQRLADELESLITAAPTQWHLMQPNWPSDRRS